MIGPNTKSKSIKSFKTIKPVNNWSFIIVPIASTSLPIDQKTAILYLK